MPFEDLLNDEIVRELGDLEDQEVGSDVYKVTVDGLVKLIDRATEIRKIENAAKDQAKAREDELALKRDQLSDQAKARDEEMKLKRDQLRDQTDARNEETKLKREQLRDQIKAREEETKLKQEQIRDDRIDKIARNVLTGFTFGGTMFTIWCLASATFTFEEKGTITSSLGRKVLGMLVPKL